MLRLFFLVFSVLLLLLATAAMPVSVYAARGEGKGGVAGALGWVAIGAGALGTVPFLLYVRVKKLSVVALGGSDAITRELAVVMTVLTASGIVLRFSSGNVRAFTRLLHGQIVMSALLVVLIAPHVSSMVD